VGVSRVYGATAPRNGDTNLCHLFVDVAANAVSDEAVGVVAGGQINREAVILADVANLVPAFFHDVGVNVEVGEKSEHDEHVA